MSWEQPSLWVVVSGFLDAGTDRCPDLPSWFQGLSLNLEDLPNRDHLISKHYLVKCPTLLGTAFLHLRSGPGKREGVCD